MSGKLFLCGGGDEKQTSKVDEVFFENANKVLYIPVAWPNEDFESCLEWFNNMASQHKKVEITMLTDLNKETNLSDYDSIYIGGGNTFKLLKKIKDSNFDKKLIEYYKNGGVIYGGSAGAIIQGKNIGTAQLGKIKDPNEIGLEDLSGLNLIKNHDIDAHFKTNWLKETESYVKKTRRNLISIPEESALLVENNQYKVIGTKPITLITEDKTKQYKINANIPI